MRASPAKAHYQKTTAAARRPDDGGHAIDRHAATAYELMLAKLAEDKRRLKNVQSMERKAEVKAQLLPDYMYWIEGALDGGSGQQDDVLMTVFVWAIDTGAFELALRIGRYAIAHGLTMPDQYKRDAPCVMAEEIADHALRQDEAGLLDVRYYVEETIEVTRDADMPDEVRAKLYKANGYGLRALGCLIDARASLERAMQLHAKVGVKKDIERLDRLIKNSAAHLPPAPASGAGGAGLKPAPPG